MKSHNNRASTLLVAAAALIDIDGRVLITQRPKGKHLEDFWEFPGGKIKLGETPEFALIRELKEELNINTEESCLAPFTFVSHSYEEFHLLMPLYICRRWSGTPMPLENQQMKWVRPINLANYQMPPADQHLIGMLRDFL